MNDSTAARFQARNKRWWLWLPLLGLGGWLAVFGDKTPASGSAATSLPARARPPADRSALASPARRLAIAPAPDSLVALAPRAGLISPPEGAQDTKKPSQRDLFSVRSWNPPPPPPPAPTPAPAPVAPPLPFSFLGKKLENNAWEVYLGRGEETFIVREGQVLAGIYRVDKVVPPALVLTYLPLGQAQELPIGDTR
jgi:hypothetical protein